MSYDISLVDLNSDPIGDDDETPYHKPLTVDRHCEGGTYVLGGMTDADLNTTYNYGRYFNFRGLHGRTGRETIKEMAVAVETLGTERDDNYWASTPGNAGYAVSILLRWARQHPDGVWQVT